MRSVFEAIIPGWKGGGLPEVFPFHIKLLLRSSVLIAHFYSIINFGKPFSILPMEKKVRLMTTLYNHRSSMVRNIVQWWKLTALMLQK